MPPARPWLSAAGRTVRRFGYLIVFVGVIALAAISGVRSGRDASRPAGGSPVTTQDDDAASPTAADRGQSGDPPEQLFAHTAARATR